jgi:hypothetical protein
VSKGRGGVGFDGGSHEGHGFRKKFGSCVRVEDGGWATCENDGVQECWDEGGGFAVGKAQHGHVAGCRVDDAKGFELACGG